MSDFSCVTRRAFMQGVSAALLASTGVYPALAQPRLAVPQVDTLTLQIIVDNATFGLFLADQALPGLRVERGARSGQRMPRRTLMAEFGLSILGESAIGTQRRLVLVDFGYSAEVIANNLALLGIDPLRFDASVLSHGHLDHYGGFRGLFSRGAVGNRRLPMFVGGEEAFCERVTMSGAPPPVMGLLDRTELDRAGLRPHIAVDPIVVADHAFTTGTIPLASFERAAMPTLMRPGIGCEVSALSPDRRDSTQFPDDGEHELATCYAVKDLGLVVIASCSHRGVLNSVRRAQSLSGIDRVHAVVGGFHLVRPRMDDEARRTVAELATINPRYIVPMHCTGEVFIAEALRLMPEKVVRPYVGTRLVFGA
jgi:7,8-dihydropterin-6-yl-methyl-4-(beta-D-ribofuranosyl)aminobenzene 5'-phosphate synthase